MCSSVGHQGWPAGNHGPRLADTATAARRHIERTATSPVFPPRTVGHRLRDSTPSRAMRNTHLKPWTIPSTEVKPRKITKAEHRKSIIYLGARLDGHELESGLKRKHAFCFNTESGSGRGGCSSMLARYAQSFFGRCRELQVLPSPTSRS